MSWFEIVSAAGVVATLAGFVVVAARGATGLRWQVPAVLAAGFGAWSAYAVVDGGPVGFWALHTTSPWGVQVFLDLLLMALVAWFLLVPRLEEAGVASWPWVVLVLGTGSIGMLAALARLLHAEHRAEESRRGHLVAPR